MKKRILTSLDKKEGTERGLNVLSLFDGISCGRVALERANIPIEKYYASEIDEYTIEISKANYPDIEQIGDIHFVSQSRLPKIDLIMGGSPCQSFSIAGNGKGFKGKSGLFWEFARLVKECKPKYFLLENVASMKKEWQDIISKELKVKPIMINSALVSAQQRKRLYWTNIPNITQPEDKGIYLKDILESGVDYLYHIPHGYIKEKIQEHDKYPTLCGQSPSSKHLIVYKQETTVKVRKYPVNVEKLKSVLFEYKNDTCGNISKKLNINKTKVEHWFRKDNSFAIPDETIWFELKELLNIQTDEFDKSITEFEIRDGNYDMAKRVYDIRGKAPTLTTVTGGQQHKIIFDNYQIRKLTPVECERLQTLPDNYTSSVSNTRRYMGIGNGWTVDVITHILKNLMPKAKIGE